MEYLMLTFCNAFSFSLSFPFLGFQEKKKFKSIRPELATETGVANHKDD